MKKTKEIKDRPGWKKFKDIFPKVASGVLSAVGTVVPVAGTVGNIIDELVNKGEVSHEEATLAKQYLLTHEKEIFELEVEDRKSAREREMHLKDSVGVWVQNISAILVIIAFLALLFLVILMTTSIVNMTMANIMIGSLGTIVIQIFAYWFGSSKGSKDKTNKLETMLNSFK